jgi:cell division septation protein DedD
MTTRLLNMTTENNQRNFRDGQFRSWAVKGFILVILWLGLSACTTNLQTKVSGNLDLLSHKQTIAILPMQVMDKSQRDAASMFRRTLYANLKESDFNLLEPYLIDGLLRKNGLNHPEKYSQLNPMHLGEVLGVDAVLISRVNKVQRAYLVLHSSIELSVSLQMVDTRTGEILWRAEQTESDFQGLGKIPTGITAAALAPIYFVTNKLNLNRLTSKMVNKLTAAIKHPFKKEKEETFEQPVITAAARRDILRLEKAEKVMGKWAQKELKKSEGPAVALASANLFPIPPVTISAGYRPTKKVTAHIPELKIKNISNPASKTFNSQPLKLTQTSPFLFTIQVGAYKTKAFAEKMIHSLADKGYQAFITLLPTKEKSLMYRVQVEKFQDKNEAHQLARKLERNENLKNFVTSLNPG